MKSLLLAALTALVAGASASAAVVFDNTANTVTNFIFRTGLEHGDEVTLAGTERSVTRITFQYFGDFTGPTAATGRVRFYANNGTDALPGAQTAFRPGSLLWESASFGLATNYTEVTLEVPNVTVPDTFTWTVQFDGLADTVGNGAGLVISSPVTVGGVLSNGGIGSFNDYWIQALPGNSESWALNQFAGGNTPANFYVQIVAVPEPSMVALLGAGVAGLLVWSHRRQRR